MSIASDVQIVRDSRRVTVSGQVLAVREHRGSIFFDVGLPGQPAQQIAVTRPAGDGQEHKALAPPNIGDIVTATGHLDESALSKRRGLGQITLFTDSFRIDAVSEVPRWSGADEAERHERQASHIQVLRDRQRSRQVLRNWLDTLGYIELETSMLQRHASGAAARTFDTTANFNGEVYHLRIATEIDLKFEMARTGLPRVYEIGRSFRNEGKSPVHHPEFTSLEMYTAHMDRAAAVTVSLELLDRTAAVINAADRINFGNAPTRSYSDLFREFLDLDLSKLVEEDEAGQLHLLRSYLKQHNILDPETAELYVSGLLDYLFKRGVRPRLTGVTIVTGYLSRQMPLAASLPNQPAIADSFQVVFRGHEVVKAYNELIDPVRLRRNLAAQAKEAKEDATVEDPRLIQACRMGLPQMYGIGVGLDRFQALLTGDRIDEVIPVPVR